jgi:hypothetical protein
MRAYPATFLLLLVACRACVRFRFLQRPEYVTPGTRFVFREGRTKGIGVVVGSQQAGTTTACGSGNGAAPKTSGPSDSSVDGAGRVG